MAYIGKSPSGLGVRTRYYYTATGGETSLSGADDNGRVLKFTDGEYIDVYLNGVLLVAGTDYGTGTANTVSSLDPLSAGNIVEIVAYDIHSLAKPNLEALRKRYYKTATGGETSISGNDDNGAAITFAANAEIEVYLNGVALVQGDDYNTTTANTVGGLAALNAGDIVSIVAYEEFTLGDVVSKKGGGTFASDVTFSQDISVGVNATLHVDSTNNRVGIGTASPAHLIDCRTTGETEQVVANFSSTGDGGDRQRLEIYVDPSNQKTELYGGAGGGSENDTTLAFSTRQGASGRVEAMRIDSDGNLLVKKTVAGSTNIGFEAKATGFMAATRDGATPVIFNRKTSFGGIVTIRKDDTTVGSLGVVSTGFYIDGEANHSGIRYAQSTWIPRKDGADIDDVIDLGTSSVKFDNIFATNTNIQTSDQNEKQQISALTNAEITAAKALSKLFKTFKWNSAVESKGDNARTHTGHIAQEVQSAMTAAGLDAANYAFWCSDTWWETYTEVPAVEADEENGIDAKDAYTRRDVFETAEEAPEGATERTRLGIRYPELLAFIGAATEQRLADIETRLTALEAE